MIPSAAVGSIFLSRSLLASSSSSFSVLSHQSMTSAAAVAAPEAAAVHGDLLRCGSSVAKTERVSLASMGFIGPMTALVLLDLIVIVGNSLVVAAVLTQRKLRTVTNTFIVSLAMSDLFLGLVVLPFSSANQVLGYWPFGTVWCSAWLAIDVWLCTASILNLCAISLDRFLAIRCPFRYPSLMPPLRAKLSIAVVWILSLAICIPPLLGWKDGEPEGGQPSFSAWNQTAAIPSSSFSSSSSSSLRQVDETIGATMDSSPGHVVAIMWLPPEAFGEECPGVTENVLPKCELTSEPGYIIYSACGSFWIPMFIMVSFYVRIYRTAARATLALRRGIITKRGAVSGIASSSSDTSVNLRVHRGGGGSVQVLHLTTPPPDSPRCSSSMSSPSTDAFDRVHRFRVHLPDIQGSPESSTRNSSSHDGAKIPPGIQCLLRTACSPVYEELPRCRHVNNTACSSSSSLGGGGGGGGAGGRKGLVQIRTQLRRLNREKKAAKTVGIIVGCFIFCWSPFFTVYLLGAFCVDCTPDWVFTIFFWLGYCNSAINPIIYGLCSKDFRYAFKKLLRCSRHQSRTQLARLISGLHQNNHATTHHGSNIDFMSVVYR